METAVQQIMLGTVTKNERQARETLSRIRAAGYDALELNRFMIHPSGLFVRMLTRAAGMPTGGGGRLDWPELVREAGLGVVALHTDLGSLERESDAVTEDARSLGTDRIIVTGMYRFDYGDRETVGRLAARLNKAGKMLGEEGFSLLYHNHNAELLGLGDGRTAYDALLDETDPALVGFEFDSYWFADGGADPAYWMRRLGARMKMWHITDRTVKQKGSPVTPILKAGATEVGRGSMNLASLADIAGENGCAAAVIETHCGWIDGDPIRSAEVSADWLRGRFHR
jgi:sugar phosphate isomerase/epimerase